MIIIRTLRRDIAKYNKIDEEVRFTKVLDEKLLHKPLEICASLKY